MAKSITLTANETAEVFEPEVTRSFKTNLAHALGARVKCHFKLSILSDTLTVTFYDAGKPFYSHSVIELERGLAHGITADQIARESAESLKWYLNRKYFR